MSAYKETHFQIHLGQPLYRNTTETPPSYRHSVLPVFGVLCLVSTGCSSTLTIKLQFELCTSAAWFTAVFSTCAVRMSLWMKPSAKGISIQNAETPACRNLLVKAMSHTLYLLKETPPLLHSFFLPDFFEIFLFLLFPHIRSDSEGVNWGMRVRCHFMWDNCLFLLPLLSYTLLSFFLTWVRSFTQTLLTLLPSNMMTTSVCAYSWISVSHAYEGGNRTHTHTNTTHTHTHTHTHKGCQCKLSELFVSNWFF